MLEGLDNRMKRRVALYMVITLVDENNGSIEINNDVIKRVFNDENEVVKFENTNGVIGLAADLDFDMLNEAVLKWIADNPQKWKEVQAKIDKQASEIGIGL